MAPSCEPASDCTSGTPSIAMASKSWGRSARGMGRVFWAMSTWLPVRWPSQVDSVSSGGDVSEAYARDTVPEWNTHACATSVPGPLTAKLCTFFPAYTKGGDVALLWRLLVPSRSLAVALHSGGYWTVYVICA